MAKTPIQKQAEEEAKFDDQQLSMMPTDIQADPNLNYNFFTDTFGKLKKWFKKKSKE
jgi:hypothetical protein